MSGSVPPLCVTSFNKTLANPCGDFVLYWMTAARRESKTPPGLYARKHWHGKSSKSWKTGFQETVEFLEAGQDPNGIPSS